MSRLPLSIGSIGLAFALLTGCATSAPTDSVACNSLNCLRTQITRELRSDCNVALHRYKRYSRTTQKAIDAKYRYPLTNSEGYYSWVRVGNRAMSPDQWCRAYADAYAAMAFK